MNRILAVLAVMLLLVVGAACGSSDDAKPEATTATGGSGATAAATEAEAEPTEAEAEETEAGGAALPEGDAANGEALATSLGCVACHSTDGSALTGPTWQGLYEHEVALEDGSTVTADDAYIAESITDPNAKVVKGFAPIMPSFASQVDDQKIADIIAYIKTLH